MEGDFQLPAHGWGPLTYLRMGEGSSLHVSGTFSVGKADQVIIPKNSTVTLGGLIVDDNSRGIILEEGASLVVLNGTTIKAKSSLHVKGEFITKNLINNSGSFLSSGKGSTEIEGNLELNESASLLLSEGSKMTSGGSLISRGAGRMDLTGNSQIAFTGDMNLSQGSKYTFNDHSAMQVGGNLASTGGAHMTFSGNATGRVDMEISLRLGAILTLNDNILFSSGGDVSLADGAKISANGNAEGSIGGNVDMRNGEITTSDFSTLQVDKTLRAYRDHQVHANHQSGIFICDYENSTPVESKFINAQPSSYYGPGCYKLPVTWSSLDVKATKDQTQVLTWSTAKEWGNSHFEIERSIDGTNHFVKIGEVQGAGWSTGISHYSFSDQDLPKLSNNIYYRVKQEDFDGQYNYSQVIKAQKQIPHTSSTPFQWTAYPNPTRGNQLKLRKPQDDASLKSSITVKITSSAFQSEMVTAEYGEDLDLAISSLMSKVPNGVIIIELRWKGHVTHLKIVKN